MDEKNKSDKLNNQERKELKPQDAPAQPSSHTWVDDMKQELEDYIEEQGIYIRQ